MTGPSRINPSSPGQVESTIPTQKRPPRAIWETARAMTGYSEPRCAVVVRRPRADAGARRRRAHDDGRGRLREGADGRGAVAGPQPRPGRLPRAVGLVVRTRGVVGDRAVPVAGLQAVRPGLGVGRDRLREGRPDVDAGRGPGAQERAVDGHGRRRAAGRVGGFRGGRIRTGVQGGCAVGGHGDRRRGRTRWKSDGDRGGGDPFPDRSGGLARL